MSITPKALYVCLFVLFISIPIFSTSVIRAEVGMDIPEAEEGVYLEINTRTNQLTVYVNGEQMNTFPVATGRTGSQTPPGWYRIVTKVENPWYIRKKIPGGDPANPLGTRWMGINVPGTGGYTYGIHGTNEPGSIGHSVSGGCIRMHNADIEWLYRHIPLKTRVLITKE